MLNTKKICFFLASLYGLQASQQLIQLIRGIKISFQLTRRQPLAQIINPPRQQIQRGAQHFAIRQNNIAPSAEYGLPASRNVSRNPGPATVIGKPILIEPIVKKRS